METGNRPLIARRYRIQDRLGKGGMGEVWSALDLLTKKKLALKQLALSGFRSPVPGTAPAPPMAAETGQYPAAPTSLQTETIEPPPTPPLLHTTPTPRI